MTREILLRPTDTESAEFTISYWKFDPGESVRGGDELVVVESVEEKTALAVTSPCAGVLAEIVAREGQVVIRPMMYVALTYDHRIVDGREAVTFLVRIKELIENPERIMMEI